MNFLTHLISKLEGMKIFWPLIIPSFEHAVFIPHSYSDLQSLYYLFLLDIKLSFTSLSKHAYLHIKLISLRIAFSSISVEWITEQKNRGHRAIIQWIHVDYVENVFLSSFKTTL